LSAKIRLKELSKDELIDIILEKEKKIKNLERELRKYKNPNTPSSANKHLKENTQGLKAKKGAKRGAPKGHKGATLLLPLPDQIIPVTTDQCSSCCSFNVEPTGYVKTKKVICHTKQKRL